jgi:paraquat-inducible protein B
VGAFVLGAVAIVLAAVALLSAGNWFARRDRFSVFFPGSVRGLNQGAAVTFRGVKIGQVEDVKAVLTGQADPLIQIEVVIEIRRDVVESPPGAPPPFALGATPAEYAKALVDRGIRARMMSASLLTGQRYVELDFLPDEPPRLAGLKPRYPELPTTPTPMEKLGDRAEEFFGKLAELPLAEMLEDLRKTLSSLRELTDSPDLDQLVASANRSARKLEPVLEEARATFETAEKTLSTLSGEASQTAGEARQTLRDVRERLDQAERSLRTLEDTLRGGDETRLTATQAIDELTRTLKALRNLVDYIQTHPEAVVLGKERREEKK